MSSDTSQNWLNEYQNKGIPSSFRKEPTSVLKNLDFSSIPKGSALDLGCGRGRNSFFLAAKHYSVTAIDMVAENIAYITRESCKRALSIDAFTHTLGTLLPLKDNAFDFAIDIFCYKHLSTKENQAIYRSELSRILKPDAKFLISLAHVKDSFYGALTPSLPHNQVIDPHTNFPSFLYTKETLEKEFSDFFTPEKIWERDSTSPMHGKIYPRKVLNALFSLRVI